VAKIRFLTAPGPLVRHDGRLVPSNAAPCMDAEVVPSLVLAARRVCVVLDTIEAFELFKSHMSVWVWARRKCAMINCYPGNSPTCH
jgi:hypothetical protein